MPGKVSKVIVIQKELLNSEAFRTLSGTAKTVYLDFRMKCQPQKIKGNRKERDAWIIKNNGELEYTYSEAEKRGISRSRFMRAIDMLVDRGFIDIAHSGAGGVKGDKSKYAISERWRKWGTGDFLKATRPKDTRSGRGFKRYWEKQKSKHGYRKR